MTAEALRTFASPMTTSLPGGAWLYEDHEGFDYHVDVPAGPTDAETGLQILNIVHAHGLQLLDDGEGDVSPEPLDNGLVRLWLTPIVPVDL